MLIATTMSSSSLMFRHALSLSVPKFPHVLSNPNFFQTVRPYIHSPPPFTHTPDYTFFQTIGPYIHSPPPFTHTPDYTFFQTVRPYIHSPPPFTHTPDDAAVSLFISMLHMRPTPPILQFNKILGSLVKTKQYATAISLSQQMEITPGEITPSFVTLSILMDCYCRVGQMTFAFSVFGKILKRGYQPDTVTLNTLMRGFCINGEVQKAVLFHNDVIAKGFRLNKRSYSTLLGGLCRMGETRAAFQLMTNLAGHWSGLMG